MSELKVASCFEFEKVLRGRSNKLFYSKSEVDAVLDEKDKIIAELKEQYKDMDVTHTVHIAKMNAKIEELESNERRLKRALWLARALRAEARKNYWYARSIHEGDERLWSIDGSAVKYIGCIKRTNFDWLKIWCEVEIKCLKKVEQYK